MAVFSVPGDRFNLEASNAKQHEVVHEWTVGCLAWRLAVGRLWSVWRRFR
ncbi:hypothetical protein D187_008491 [Cystobacter fuscus DSM 2262]|uniref:Uncharacterized protein n=1 Tax=Cystobacter fuscus (strain ATCC 25194 / DSM 2262 / NBRC 100088 / M29) TaxID=1242864 RepID=S9QLZ2_CYSF2|nr:hypothetical protein D187_008491 [Cystobacter fuscus DSM 2262]